MTDDEDNLWREVTKTIKPLKNKKPVVTPVIKVRKAVIASQEFIPDALPKNVSSPLAQKQIKKLRQKKIPVEGSIDLHGMVIEKAHQAAKRFLQDAFKNQLRCVEVITGRGDPLRGTGLLKRELPIWLVEPNLRAIILHCEENPASRGGSYLIMLRRNKSAD
jgi:DNA-nicking Smr family endonuclease